MEYICRPSTSKICCWDRNKFNASRSEFVIHCPIYYKPKQIVRKKREYYINQNVRRTENLSKYPEIPHKIISDFAFCSKECCSAWINEHKTNPLYKHSVYIFINEHGLVDPANDWRIIDTNGGFMDISTFRKHEKRFTLIDSYENETDQTLEYVFKENLTVL